MNKKISYGILWFVFMDALLAGILGIIMILPILLMCGQDTGKSIEYAVYFGLGMSAARCTIKFIEIVTKFIKAKETGHGKGLG